MGLFRGSLCGLAVAAGMCGVVVFNGFCEGGVEWFGSVVVPLESGFADDGFEFFAVEHWGLSGYLVRA